jgi:dTDP-4-amino-4,6-dideoxygalactose transaminase
VSRIPLVDLQWQQAEVEAEVTAGWAEVLATNAFIQGPAAHAFEDEFARFCGVAHCVGLANGTDALELSLRAAGVGTGDRVVVPANTFVATAEAVVRTGAQPVLVDCDPVHSLCDVDQTIDAMRSARAVVPVHLYGQLAPIEQIIDAARSTGCAVIEDAAQSQGASRDGRSMGAWGDLAATSFYPGKNLGAYGDAGAVVTDDARLADHVRKLGNHGSGAKYVHDTLGFNSRLDGLQAVVLRAKLRRLHAWNELRREAAARYQSLLADVDGVMLPSELEGNTHVWHLFVIRVPHRDQVITRLHDAGVEAGVHYPTPVHLHPPFASLANGAGSFPVAERTAGEILSLPIYPGITADQQERVASELARAVSAARASRQ